MSAKTVRVVSLAAVSLASLFACGPEVTPPVVTPTAPSASVAAPSVTAPASVSVAVDPLATPPPAEGTVTFVPPQIQESKLTNGVRVLFVERHELPIVSVQLVTDRGGDQTAPATCAFMASMLTQGTKRHGALALADAIERIGAHIGASCSVDSVGVSGKVLSSKLPALVDLLAEIARTPTFEAKEIERERAKRLTTLQQQKDSPGAIATRTLDATLYPAGHPYALPLLGDEAALKGLKRADLVAARGATLTPGTTTIVVAGDVSFATLTPMLEKAFGDWNEPTPVARPIPARPEGSVDPRIVIVDRPGAPQSTLQVVRVGVARDPGQFAAVFLTNYIFGGHFASRLNMNLREAHAYTYGARSGFSMWHGPGPFSAGGEIKTDKTAEALKEMLGELSRIRDTQVSDEELSEAQSGLIDQIPGRFGTVEETTDSLGSLVVYHLPLDEYATRPARYKATTKADVQRVAKDLLRSDDLRVVIVGDASKIEAPLTALGLGRIEVRRKVTTP